MKAKFWARCVCDSVDTVVVALAGKVAMKGVRHQGVGCGSDHFDWATILGSSLGKHGPGEDEKGGDEPRQIEVEKHCSPLLQAYTVSVPQLPLLYRCISLFALINLIASDKTMN